MSHSRDKPPLYQQTTQNRCAHVCRQQRGKSCTGVACWSAACTLGHVRWLCESVILLEIMTCTPEASGALPLHASTSCTQGGDTAHPWSTAAPRTVQAAGCSGSQASWSECQYWYCRTAQNFSMGLGSETFPGELGASRHLQPTGKIPDEGGAGGGGAAGPGLTACRPGTAEPVAAGAGAGVVTTELTSPARQVFTQLLALFVEPAQGGHNQLEPASRPEPAANCHRGSRSQRGGQPRSRQAVNSSRTCSRLTTAPA